MSTLTAATDETSGATVGDPTADPRAVRHRDRRFMSDAATPGPPDENAGHARQRMPGVGVTRRGRRTTALDDPNRIIVARRPA